MRQTSLLFVPTWGRHGTAASPSQNKLENLPHDKFDELLCRAPSPELPTPELALEDPALA